MDVYDIYKTVQRIKAFEMRKQQECIPVDAYRPLFTVQGVSVWGGSVRGGFSVQGVGLYQGGLCPGGVSVRETPQKEHGTRLPDSDIIQRSPRCGQND